MVQNQDINPLSSITDVWCRIENTNEWILYWHGEKKTGEDASFFMPPASYDVKIRVKYLLLSKDFQTGYKTPIKVRFGNVKFIIFDGIGIYDMESNHF